VKVLTEEINTKVLVWGKKKKGSKKQTESVLHSTFKLPGVTSDTGWSQ